MFDKPQEECGVFGIYNTVNKDINVVSETYLALYALQHRGQASSGIAVSNDGEFNYYKDKGTASNVFTDKILQNLRNGEIAIGHVRYAAKGDEGVEYAQPLVIRYSKGNLSIACNGVITNAHKLRTELEYGGSIFQTGSNVEIISLIIAKERTSTSTIEEAVEKTVAKLEGAFSLVVMSPHKLIAVRDKKGFRPLCLGEYEGSVVVASESCAIESICGNVTRDINPGEIVVIDENGITSKQYSVDDKQSLCVFEYVYFARPDSVIDGQSVHLARQEAGRILSQTSPIEADIVCGVPDSGLDAAIGYSAESNIPYGIAFIKNKYIGRTFIEDTQKAREKAVKIKLNVLKSSVRNKRVVLIDDSIVRGTTIKYIVKLLKDAGAKAVHVRIVSPKFLYPCYFGTDISSKENLIACKYTTEQICEMINADSLEFLPIEALDRVAKNCRLSCCKACFNGEYPVEVETDIPKNKYEQKIKKL